MIAEVHEADIGTKEVTERQAGERANRIRRLAVADWNWLRTSHISAVDGVHVRGDAHGALAHRFHYERREGRIDSECLRDHVGKGLRSAGRQREGDRRLIRRRRQTESDEHFLAAVVVQFDVGFPADLVRAGNAPDNRHEDAHAL